MSLESNKKWIFPKEKPKDIIDSILKSREISSQEEFLNPKIENIPDPSLLSDTKSAVKEILKHIKEGNKIVIHGDFDADGICSVALLWDFIYNDLAKHLDKKINVVPYIPSRIEQGYGLTESSLTDVVNLEAKLLISVDCGVRDKELIKKIRKEKNLDFVITDHHQPPEDILEDLDYPLVHQMYPGKEYPDTEICGCAVTFLLIQEIKKEVGMEYAIDENTKGLDLVALATVTDIMPLVGANRIFVTYGLKQMQKGQRLGLRHLVLRSGVQPTDIQPYHLGYVLGPRINAAGRIGTPLDAVKLLVSKNESQCREIANDLNNLNFERQQMTQEVLEQSRNMVGEEEKIIFVDGEDWHEGIIGLAAGKLLEEFYKPVIVATKEASGDIRASARSIKGFNITKALEENSKYLERYGGHELAAGFSLKEENLEAFKKSLQDMGNEKITEEMLLPEVKIDIALDTDDVDFKLVENLKQLEPFGNGNPKPTIALKDVVIFKKTPMGKEKNHLKLMVKGESIDLLTVILFGCNEDVEKLNEDDKISLIGYPDINVWNGQENIQFLAKEWKR